MAKLILADETIFWGDSFGYPESVCGEVVFNTTMTGYVETLTDPSYSGQILVMTFPLQGNYGVPRGGYESEKIQIKGLIVAHYTEKPNHFSCLYSLADWLKLYQVPAICNVDTRTLTHHLREIGTSKGELQINSKDNLLEKPTNLTLQRSENLTAPILYGTGDIKILLVDTGCKENIIQSLLKRKVSIIRVPWNSEWEFYLNEVDGILFPNGPGDPMNLLSLVKRIRALFSKNIPIFGICLGHQLLALAAGGKTKKMKYGHRSVNQPVIDVLTKRCYITTQNHGYVVVDDSLPGDWKTWFININDQTNEGYCHASLPIKSVQFHPEACPGPNDTNFLFDEFINTIIMHKKLKNHIGTK